MRILSFNEAAERLGYHPQHLRKLIAARKIPAPFRLHDGGRPLYTAEMVEEIFNDRINAARRAGSS